MTDEQKAKRRAWAESHFGDKNLTDEELDCATYMPSENFSDGWDKGVDFALSHQWISVEERLPEAYTDVLIATDKGQIRVSHLKVARSVAWTWPGNVIPKVIAWMPLPKYNPEKQSI